MVESLELGECDISAKADIPNEPTVSAISNACQMLHTIL